MNAVTVILNTAHRHRRKAIEEITAAFEKAGGSVNIIAIRKSDDCRKLSEKWVLKAKEDGSVVVAAGGDGTVNLVAGLCYRHHVALGILPRGTFNYFARGMNIPADTAEAAKIIMAGHRRQVTVGLLKDHVFLNNASFGLYTRLIRHREQASSSFGRWRIIAALAAAYSLLSRQKLYSVCLQKESGKQYYQTPLVFIGNNTLQLENLGLKAAECTRRDNLAIIVMKKTSRWQTARFIFRGMIRNLRDESKLEESCGGNFTIETDRKSIGVVIDGEIIRCATPLAFSVAKDALEVVVPEAAE